jgi:nicotinamidase-related amidase
MMDSQVETVMLELQVPKPQAVTVDPAKTALVIIDMENDFAKPEGYAYHSPRRGAVIQPIAGLLARCREAGLPVIFVQSIRDPDSPEFRIYGQEPYILRGTWGSQIVEELTPLPDEPVVEKNSHDPFNHTRLDDLLAERGIDPEEWTILVVGLGLANCVNCAVSGFSVRQYRVLLPMDCTAASSYEQELCLYQRFMQRGYSYNVTLTRSDLIQIAARALAGARAGGSGS